MSKTPNIRINTEGFRAINKADIIIDGITLVAGENGCGKSTLSKLLYFLYKTVANYDNLVKDQLFNSLQDVLKLFEIIQLDAHFSIDNRRINLGFRKEIVELRKDIYNSDFIDDQLASWLDLVDKTEALYLNNVKDTIVNHSSKSNRIRFIIRDVLQERALNDEDEVEEPFMKIKELITKRFKQASFKIKSRPTSLFTEELKNVFNEGKLPDKFEVSEYNDLIVSLEKQNLSIPFSIQRAIYIDTPMMISVENRRNEHWRDLNEMLIEKGNNRNNLESIISSEIINGDVDVEEDIYTGEKFKFKRKDGEIYNLLDVATGIKSFSILQLLLKNGILNDKTLLIIDEPESNLHPQWIIEYARVIVLLNKKLGVKFFLASHNPDMVSAIRYISEKEQTLDNVNFYIAKKVDNTFVYDYEYLGKEIDPIFESFNIALDRVNKYGI